VSEPILSDTTSAAYAQLGRVPFQVDKIRENE